MAQPLLKESSLCRPLLKWAGGKTQLLPSILPKLPFKYNKYIEPFFGGGALFYSLQPTNGVIADSNPELINLYKTVASKPLQLITELGTYQNTEKFFYELRKLDVHSLDEVQQAARTIFLNRTCFNGLYRVNKQGKFNVPYGRYKNPKIIDEQAILNASELLSKTDIICGNYLQVLLKYAKKGDLVFLDPPYLPVSEYSDFKRYTKEQFYEEDHVELAREVERLHSLGCHVILTNSNHPLVHDLYSKFQIEVLQTRRYISCNAKTRKGEDVIVNIPPSDRMNLKVSPQPLPEQLKLYPSTRYMGSKTKLLADIWAIASQFQFSTVLDLFSGSGIVGYMFKAQGKKVISNDYMHFSSVFSKALVENNKVTVTNKDIVKLLCENSNRDKFVEQTFSGLYFRDEENIFIDTVRANITALRNPYKKAIAMNALIRACFKKRPRGVFTYIGHRYDDGRADLAKSFKEHFIQAITDINAAVFDNKQDNASKNGDAMNMTVDEPCLVYIDPPYYSPLSDNEYVRRYHFVEGLAREWKGVEIQEHTTTKKFKSYPTPFSSRKGAVDAFDVLFKKFSSNILLVSYSSNSLPTRDEMVSLMAKYKSCVDVYPINHKYSFGNQNNKIGDNNNSVKEYLFIGY